MGKSKQRSSTNAAANEAANAAANAAEVEDRSARGATVEQGGGEPLNFTRPLFAALLIVVVGLCAYLNSFQGVFTLDDRRHILEDSRIHQLWPITAHLTRGTRPLVNLSLAINYALGEADEFGYHVFNVAVHLLAGLALFGLVRRTLLLESLRPRFGGQATKLALIIALIWVVHPLATQAVTYIIQRAESMMGLFYLTTLYCVVRQSQSRRPMLWSVAAVAACALGLGSKAVMITAPVVVLLYDRAFLSPSFSQLWRRRWGLYLGLAAMWVIPLSTGLLVAVLNPDRAGGTVGLGYRGFTPWQYAQSQPGVILHYLSLAVWPSHLCFDYWWPIATDAANIIFPGMVLLAMLTTTGWALWRRPKVGFVAASFFIILSPTSSFVPIQDLAFEHRMYLPLVAVVTLVVFGGWWLLQRMARRKSWSPSFGQAIGTALVVIVVLALGVRTIARNADYHQPEQLWQKVLDLRPENPRAYHGMGVALLQLGKFDQAEPYFLRSVQLNPANANGYLNLGAIVLRRAQFDEAIEYLEQCLRINPHQAGASEVHNNLCVAYTHTGQLILAIEHGQAAITVNPNNHVAHKNLADALAKDGQIEPAMRHYETDLSLDPKNVEAHQAFAELLADQGQREAAIEHYAAVVQLDPQRVTARFQLGWLLVQTGRFDDGLTHLQQVRQRLPRAAQVPYAIGYAYQQQGRIEDAAAEYRRALELDPKFERARTALDNLSAN